MPLPGPVGPRRLRTALVAAVLLSTALAANTATDPAPDPAPAASPGLASVPQPFRHVVRVDRRTRIAATFPERVETRTRIRATGSVFVRAGKQRAPRPVRLLERRPNGSWKLVAKKRSTRVGVFRFVVPAGQKARTRTFRVRAPRSAGLEAVTTGNRTVVVTSPATPTPPTPTPPTPTPPTPPTPPDLGYTPLGSAADWTYLVHPDGTRWNACQTISWTYNPAGEGYPEALADTREAFDRISERSGLQFRFAGVASHTSRTNLPGDLAMTVEWSDASREASLGGTVVGIGGGAFLPARPGQDVDFRLVRGSLVLDREETLRAGHDVTGSPTWGQVITHELLHALGLGHADGSEQVMARSVSSLNHRFGAGDLTGMDRIGAGQGCLR